MTSTGKTWTAIIIVIVIVAVGWIWYRHSSNPETDMSATSAPLESTNPSADAGVSMSASSDTSDAALNQDLSSVDSQMNNLSADQSNADAGMNASAQ